MANEPQKTPGVYIVEENAFPNSVVAVETAIPAFIGYTEKAVHNGNSLHNQPIKVTSMADFINYFGGMPKVKFTLTEDKSVPPVERSVSLNSGYYSISPKPGTLFYLYNCVRLFYQNGGEICYVISVGDYSAAPRVDSLKKGIDILKHEQDPTMMVIPDGLLLDKEVYYSTLIPSMLAHCQNAQSRMAILDVYNGDTTNVTDLSQPSNVILDFRNGIGTNSLNYGVAYYPWLRTTIIQNGDINFTNFGDDLSSHMESDITDNVNAQIAIYKNASDDSKEATMIQVHNALLAMSKNYTNIIKAAMANLNILPPGPAMAGIYTYVDKTRGVWKAPANVSLSAVTAPTVNINDNQQETLNVDATGGKSINVIRSFTGLGVLVWGARTLDGNSQDWRYVNVRRTMIMIEQSVKLAAHGYVFEPNDANTWASVKSMINNFLSNLWKQGALAGSKPEDAFQVMVGLGSTMTADDILDGNMFITVLVAVSHPAEFIVITFKQKQQTS